MGKVASRCLKGCEGGKNEIGEENLEQYHLDQTNPMKNNSQKKEDLTGELDYKSKSKSGNRKIERFIEENKRNFKNFY